MNPGERRAVEIWLLVCAAFTFAMVVVGGITRLTESGLSIVEWQPLIGALPPLLLAVPVPLGAAHQAGAVALLAAALWTAHAMRQRS